MESDISASKCPEEILRILGALCGVAGQIEQIQLYCHKGSPRETTGFIEMKGDLDMAARRIKGIRLGNSSLCKSLSLSPEFRCARRPEGELLFFDCNLCRVVGSELASTPECLNNDSQVSGNKPLERENSVE